MTIIAIIFIWCAICWVGAIAWAVVKALWDYSQEGD